MSSVGDFFTRALEWIGERFTATFTWLVQDRASIREELTQRMTEMHSRDRGILSALGRSAVLDNGLTILQDRLTRGGMTPETQARIAESFGERVAQLPASDQALLREVRRLSAAGGFSDEEYAEAWRQAGERARQQRSR